MNNESTPTGSPEDSRISIDSDELFGDVSKNVESDVIVITTDKLENILLRYLSRLRIRQSWATPLALFVTTFLAIVTANFTDALMFSGAFWKAVFGLGAVGASIWFGINIVRAFYFRRALSPEHLIGLIKSSEENSEDGEM